MNERRSIEVMAWVTILAIMAMAAVTTCSGPLPTERVNVQDLRGAAKYQAMREVQP